MLSLEQAVRNLLEAGRISRENAQCYLPKGETPARSEGREPMGALRAA